MYNHQDTRKTLAQIKAALSFSFPPCLGVDLVLADGASGTRAGGGSYFPEAVLRNSGQGLS